MTEPEVAEGDKTIKVRKVWRTNGVLNDFERAVN